MNKVINNSEEEAQDSGSIHAVATARPQTPEATLRREVRWKVGEAVFSPRKSPNTELKIALIGGERLYESLRYEGEVIPITPDNWPHVFRYSKPDLFIVESCFETASGHWFMAQTEAAIETSSLALLIETAQRAGIPTIY